MLVFGKHGLSRFCEIILRFCHAKSSNYFYGVAKDVQNVFSPSFTMPYVN